MPGRVAPGRVTLLAGLLLVAGVAQAADHSLPVTGNLFGSVVDPAGVPQIGATIQVVNKYQRVIAQTLSGKDGRFAVTSIPNDVYSVRASLPTYLPALKNKVLIQGGVDSILQIHLATLFSSIEVSYAIPTAGMTDDWKWVLRSSPSTRPINRYVDIRVDPQAGEGAPPPLFSNTHAAFSVSGGGGGLVDSGSTLADLGTGFALSTNIYGNNQLQVSGVFGESPTTGAPQVALLATYKRQDDATLAHPPEVTLTMSQVGGIGSPLTAGGSLGGTAPLRAMSLSVYNTADPLDGVHLEYGATGESVDFLQNSVRVSPFARVTLDAGKVGEVIASYSDGSRPDILARHSRDGDDNTDDIGPARTNAMGRVPGISNRGSRLRLERTQNVELGVRKVVGSVTYGASAFYEDTIDGRLNVAGDLNNLPRGDLLSDSISTTSYFNIGSFRRTGYLISSTRRFGDNLTVSLAYGRAGGFSLNGTTGTSSKPLPVQLDQRNIAAVNVKAAVPGVGTRITAGYGWVDAGSVVPYHAFTTQNLYVAPGLNICFRQPLPGLFGSPGHIELTGSLQNLLAQGYLPVAQGAGHQLLVVQSPRMIRGGLNFVF